MRKGDLVNQYVIEELIGKGQFGKVFRVHDKDDIKKIYAIKMIEIRNNYSTLKPYIETEIESMKEVECENSVKLMESFDYSDDFQGYRCLVLELCDGVLNDIHEKNIKNSQKFNELEVYMIMSQLNNCLKKMREGKKVIIHRDLKLDNILIKKDERIPIIKFSVKLSDFGLSKKMKDNDDLTNTQLGTPLTKAPEIWAQLNYNAKSDLWSIGIIIYQLLFNKTPFNVETQVQLKNWIKKFK